MSQVLCLSAASGANPEQENNSPLSPLSPVGEFEIVALIDKEVERLDALSRQIFQERVILLRKRNTLCPAISRLPVEVLCTIFHYIVFPVDLEARSLRPWAVDHPSHLPPVDHPIFLVTSVSHQWRLIARSTPRLWDTMVLNIRPGQVTKASNLLQLHLELSSDHHFFLEVNLLWGSGFSHYFGDLSPVENLIFDPSNAGRFRTLYLSMPPDEWGSAFNDAAASFVSLENFRVAWDREWFEDSQNNGQLHLEPIPALQRCILKYVTYKPYLPSTHLTVLILYGLPIANCVELLVQCPALVEYRSREAQRTPTKTPFPIPAGGLTMHHMKTFIFSFCEDPWCNGLLERLRLPVLEHLGFEGLLCNLQIPFGPVLQFCSHLPPSVITLEFRRSFFGTTPMAQIFGLFPRIKKLVLFDEESTKFIKNQLLILNPASCESGSIRYLPELEHISIDLLQRGFRLRDDEVGEIPFLLKDFLMGRKEGLNQPFGVDVWNIDTQFWALEVEEALKEMVCRGHKLDFRLGGKPARFLQNLPRVTR